MIKLSTRYSSRTAADLKELDQQFKGWMKILAGDLGVRSLRRSSDVMMVGEDPYGIRIIEDYHNLPKGSTITVEMMDVSENTATLSMKATFKESWVKQVVKHNTGGESITISGPVELDDPSKAHTLVKRFVESIGVVEVAELSRRLFNESYAESASELRVALGNSLKRSRLIDSPSDIVLSLDSYTATVESAVPYGVGGLLIKGVLSRVYSRYERAKKPAPRMVSLMRASLMRLDEVVDETLGSFTTSDGVFASTYLRSATWKGDDVQVNFMLTYADDGKVIPPQLRSYIASFDMRVRQAYLRHTLKQASRSYVLAIDSDGAAAHGRRLSSTPQRSRSRSVEGCDELANSMVIKLTVGLQTPYSHVRVEKPGYHQQVFKVFLPETGLLYMLVKTQVALDEVESPIQISVTFPEKVPDWAEMKVKEVVGRTDGVILRRKGSPDDLLRDASRMSRAVLNVIRPLVDFVVNRSKVGDQIERVAYDPLNYKVESLLSPHFGSRIEAHSLADGQDGYKGGDFPYLLRHFTIRGILKEDQVADPRFEDDVRSKILSALEPLKTAFNAENLGVDLSEDVIFDYSWEEIQVRFMVYSLDDQNFIRESDRKRELM